MSNLAQYGNTSAASIPLALDQAVRGGLIKPGDKVGRGVAAVVVCMTAVIVYMAAPARRVRLLLNSLSRAIERPLQDFSVRV